MTAPLNTLPVKVVATTLTTDTAGNVIDSVPVYPSDVPIQNAAGEWVQPAQGIAAETGMRVRVVSDKVVTNSAGKPVSPIFMSGVGGTIVLSNNYISELSATPSAVGTLSVVGGVGSWTFSELLDPDSKFGVTGSMLNKTAAVAYDTQSSHSVTIRATNGTDTIDQVFTIFVQAVPAQIGSSDWSVADLGTNNDALITILIAPNAKNSAIIRYEYQVGAGSWTTLGTSVGAYPIAGLTDGVSVNIGVRAVNGIGNGTGSATKAVTSTGIPAAFVDADWSVHGHDSKVTVTVATNPASNGSAITAIQYSKDGGAWTNSGISGPGNFDIAGTNGVSISVQLRAVNGNGAGPTGNTESATPSIATNAGKPIGLLLALTYPSGGPSALYTIADFTSGDGLSISNLVDNGDGTWTVTLTDGVDSHSATFTEADLAAIVAGTLEGVVWLDVTDLGGGEFEVTDDAWTFYAPSIAVPEHSYGWDVDGDGIDDDTGSTFNFSGYAAYTYRLLNLRMHSSLLPLDEPVIVEAQAATPYTAPQVRTNASAYLSAANGGGNSAKLVLMFSFTPSAGMTLGVNGTFGWENVTNTGLNGSIGSLGEVQITLCDSAGGLLSNIARTGSAVDRRGHTIGMVISCDSDGVTTGAVKCGFIISGSAPSVSGNTTITAGRTLKTSGALRVGRNFSLGGNVGLGFHALTVYHPTTIPASMSDMVAALLDTDGKPKIRNIADEFFGVAPVVDVRHDAAGWAALQAGGTDYSGATWGGTLSGTPPYFVDVP